MGKPLRNRELSRHGLKDNVLAYQGVKVNKRKRLGHTGHFGRVEVIPVAGKVTKIQEKGKGRKRKNKFKEGEDGEEGQGKQEEDAVMEEEPHEENKPVQRTERLPGESFNKFMKRLNKETRESLVKQNAKAQKVNEKRKSYLDKRKLEKKVAKAEKNAGFAKKDDDEDEKVPQADLEAMVPRFGEQAQRPPQIRLDKALKGLHRPVAPQPGGNGSYIVGGMPSIPELAGSEKKKREMEMLRKNAISQYRAQVQQKREGKGLVSLGKIKM